MTRREYLEHKIEKRKEWAAKAKTRSDQHREAADRLASAIPLGQPILIGHHSEKRARRDFQRIHNNMDKCVENAELADHHESKAAGLAQQLDKTVFSDDVDALEQLTTRIAEHEKMAESMTATNKAWRKYEKTGDTTELIALGLTEVIIERFKAKIAAAYSWEKKPFPTWALTNLRARIRTDRLRIEEIKKQQERRANAENAGGISVENIGDYVRITFAEKPTREILDALRSSGFSWGGGSWSGRRDAIPSILAGSITQEA